MKNLSQHPAWIIVNKLKKHILMLLFIKYKYIFTPRSEHRPEDFSLMVEIIWIKKKKNTFDNQLNGAAFLFIKYSAGKQSILT